MAHQSESLFFLISVILTLVLPPLYLKPLWEERSPFLIRIGLFSLVVGFLIGSVCPSYFSCTEIQSTILVWFGLTFFLVYGCTSLISFWLGNAGYAISLCAYGYYMHFFSTSKLFLEGGHYIKLYVILSLLMASLFLIISFDLKKPTSKSEKKQKRIQSLVALFGAVVTIMKFTFIFIEMLKKS